MKWGSLPEVGLLGVPSQARGSLSHLEEQLVFGDPLDWLQQVGVQAQLVVQFLLAFLQPPHLGLDSFQESLLESTSKGQRPETYLEERTVGALPPQALGAGLVLTVLLVDLELLHLGPGQTVSQRGSEGPVWPLPGSRFTPPSQTQRPSPRDSQITPPLEFMSQGCISPDTPFIQVHSR